MLIFVMRESYVNKYDVVQMLLVHKNKTPAISSATAFAPTNIAVCKYWGKRNSELNLPLNSSLSLTLENKGTLTTVSVIEEKGDEIILNHEKVPASASFFKRVSEFLDLFRFDKNIHFKIATSQTIPTACGVASSASGFAALTLALNKLYAWNLEDKALSILARLGSGSACRSLWSGFVEWVRGSREDGMDSFGKPLTFSWPELHLGLLILQTAPKMMSSREAMALTVKTSQLMKNWPAKAAEDLTLLKQSIKEKNFKAFGEVSEENALYLHRMMQEAYPPINYNIAKTHLMMDKIKKLREEGLALYFTQDAGPNLKLLFLKNDALTIKKYFPEVEIVALFK